MLALRLEWNKIFVKMKIWTLTSSWFLDVRRFLLEKCDVNMAFYKGKNKNFNFMVSNL